MNWKSTGPLLEIKEIRVEEDISQITHTVYVETKFPEKERLENPNEQTKRLCEGIQEAIDGKKGKKKLKDAWEFLNECKNNGDGNISKKL